MKEGKLTLTTDVTITEVMMDILQADCPYDITVDKENHLVISKDIENCEDVEEEIQHLKNIMKDLEGAMLNREVEEEAKKAAEEDQKEVDEKWAAFNEDLDRIVDDVLAKKYGQVRIAIFADNPTRVAYRGNMPPEAGTLFAFLVANN